MIRSQHNKHTGRPIRTQGFTLIEAVIALSIIAVIAVVLGQIIMSSTNSLDYLVTSNVSDQELKRGLNSVLNELRMTSTTRVTLVTDTDSDTLTFQTPDTYSGSIDWGASDNTGDWNVNWTVRYTVVGSQLVRQVFDGGGNQQGDDEILVRDVNPVSPAKGFQVTQTGSIMNVAIRVNKTQRDGNSYEKQMSSSVFLKNS